MIQQIVNHGKNWYFAFFPPKIRSLSYSHLILFDGDQSLVPMFNAFEKKISQIVRADDFRVEVVKMHCDDESPPKILKKYPEFIYVPLTGFSAKKEVVDKWIAIRIQQAISQGCRQISVVSSDFDFVDIFKMILSINQENGNDRRPRLEFSLFVPKPSDKMRLGSRQNKDPRIKIIFT